jgi:hypothetical protein
MKNQLLEIVRQILKGEKKFEKCQARPFLENADDVVVIDFEADRSVVVKLLADVGSTDVVLAGVLAHNRLTSGTDLQRCLLVLPNASIPRPLFLTPRVALCHMSAEQVHEALLQLSAP